jgi:hypothetical protein
MRHGSVFALLMVNRTFCPGVCLADMRGDKKISSSFHIPLSLPQPRRKVIAGTVEEWTFCFCSGIFNGSADSKWCAAESREKSAGGGSPRQSLPLPNTLKIHYFIA